MSSNEDKIIRSSPIFPDEVKGTIEKNGNSIEVIYKRLNENLGQGGFGKVYKFQVISGEGSDNKEFIAGKIIKKEIYITDKRIEIKLLQDEINLQKNLNRSDIVNVINYVDSDEYVYIFLELCKNGSLRKLLNDRNHLTEKEVQCYMYQIIIALNYIHSNNVIHRDLKLENILLGDNMEIKIGDFGLATKLDRKSKRGLNQNVGTFLYKAPEILSEKEYSYEIEIWSLGIIMCFLLTGIHPFEGKTKEDTMKNILDINKLPYSESKCKMSPAAKNLIEQLLVKDPSKRPTLNQIIYHDFFNREGIPKYFGEDSFYKEPEDFSNEILNKEATMNDLISIVRPIINPNINYQEISNINDIKKNNIIDIDIYVKIYLNYNDKFGIGYILNNGDIGVYYRDKTILLLNANKDKYLYVNKEEQIIKYNIDDIPEVFNNKIKILNGFIKYFKKHINENDINSNQNKKRENDDEIYAKSVIIDKKCVIFKLSNDIEHIFFADKIEIIMSKNDNRLTYIEKNKTKTNLDLSESFNNPCRELLRRVKYIQHANIEYLSKEINKKYEEQLLIYQKNYESTEKED